jgi:hypothetical protein
MLPQLSKAIRIVDATTVIGIVEATTVIGIVEAIYDTYYIPYHVSSRSIVA